MQISDVTETAEAEGELGRQDQDPTLHCSCCGYNLTGLVQERCPECGDGFDRAAMIEVLRNPRPLVPFLTVAFALGNPAFIVSLATWLCTNHHQFRIWLCAALAAGLCSAIILSRRILIGRSARSGRMNRGVRHYLAIAGLIIAFLVIELLVVIASRWTYKVDIFSPPVCQ